MWGCAEHGRRTDIWRKKLGLIHSEAPSLCVGLGEGKEEVVVYGLKSVLKVTCHSKRKGDRLPVCYSLCNLCERS